MTTGKGHGSSTKDALALRRLRKRWRVELTYLLEQLAAGIPEDTAIDNVIADHDTNFSRGVLADLLRRDEDFRWNYEYQRDTGFEWIRQKIEANVLEAAETNAKLGLQWLKLRDPQYQTTKKVEIGQVGEDQEISPFMIRAMDSKAEKYVDAEVKEIDDGKSDPQVDSAVGDEPN